MINVYRIEAPRLEYTSSNQILHPIQALPDIEIDDNESENSLKFSDDEIGEEVGNDDVFGDDIFDTFCEDSGEIAGNGPEQVHQTNSDIMAVLQVFYRVQNNFTCKAK
jgi:hypothetical protein